MGLFFQNKKEYTSQSISKIAWQKFKKKKQGKLLLAFLSLMILLAVLAYLITPDSTPYANEQILEIRLQKPGTKITMLCVRKNQEIEKVNVFKKMLFGQVNPYTYIPISSYQFLKDSILVERFQKRHNISLFHLPMLFIQKMIPKY